MSRDRNLSTPRVRFIRRHSWRIGLFPSTHWYGVDCGLWRLVILR